MHGALQMSSSSEIDIGDLHAALSQILGVRLSHVLKKS